MNAHLRYAIIGAIVLIFELYTPFLFAGNNYGDYSYTQVATYHTATPHVAQRSGVYPTTSIMAEPRYATYQSSIQEPFSNTVPSESNTSFAGDAPNGITGRRNAWTPPTPSDPNQSEESPVGEPWIMLIFALIAAIVVTTKTHQKISSLTNNKG